MMKLFCKKEKREKKIDYSKKLITDIRSLLWAVTIGGIILAFYCIYKGYMGVDPVDHRDGRSPVVCAWNGVRILPEHG